MTIGAGHRLRRIIKRARALPADAAGLPVVVIVEAARPTVVVHGHIEMDFVAGGAELSCLRAHERLEEYAAVGLGIQFGEVIVNAPDDGILAGGKFVQCGIFELEIGLAHRAFHLCDRVAHHAAEAGLSGRRVFDFADGAIEHAAIKESWIVAAGAPFRWLHAGYILHVLDAFAIPRIVEGGEMVRGALPLLVDVGVAALAALRLHEV